MAKVDLDHFIFNSDYPIDQIVFYKELTIENITAGASSKTIEHNLPFIPLAFGTWSPDEKFEETHNIGGENFTDNVQVSMTSYEKTIKLDLEKDAQSSTSKIYVRLYAFAPISYKGGVQSTSRKAGKFVLDTDFPYSAILFLGELTVPQSTEPERLVFKDFNVCSKHRTAVEKLGGASISHNLKYNPQVMCWLQGENNEAIFIKQSIGSHCDYAFGYVGGELGDVIYEENKVNVYIGTDYSGRTDSTKIHLRVYANGSY